MAEKDIILRINTITDKEVMEEFGKVLNDVLGSYEDNIRRLGEYNSQIKQTQAEIARLKKIEEERGKLNETQKQQLANLTAEERKLRQASSEIQQTLKNEEKIRTTANGTMTNQAQLLGKLRMAWRQMTDEQKAANPQMLAAIQALDRHIKGADASIGNFQRNVGNYPGLMAQMGQSVVSMAASVNPAFGSVTQTVMGMTEQFGLTSGAIGAIGGVLAVAAAGFKVFQDSMELTQQVGDAVAIKVAGWEATYDKFIRMVASADFSNFWEQLRRVKEVGEETAAVLDELFERNNALTIAEAKASVEQQRNLKIMRDQTRSVEERKAAGEAYTASVMELAQKRQDIAKQEHEALLANFAAQTGASKEQISWYIENYDKYRNVANKYNADVAAAEEAYKAQQKYIRNLDGAAKAQDYADAQELYKKWQTAKDSVSNLSEEEQKFLAIQNKYNLANDKMTTQLVNSWANVYRAISGAEAATQRAATTVNSLTAQQKRQETKEAAKPAPKGKSKYANVETFEDYQLAIAEDMEKQTTNLAKWLMEEAEKDVTIPQEVLNSAGVKAAKMAREANEWLQNELEAAEAEEAPIIAPVADPSKSPLAKALGVTDEQLTSIKSQALQAAQQIYGSIQQMAQQASQRRLDDELAAIEDKTESEKAILKAKFDKGVLREEQYEKKIAEIDEQAEARREEVRKEAFEKEKRWNMATAFMNMALAVIKALTQLPPPVKWVEAALVTATGTAQIATIASQKYARGGVLRGPSHAQGGIKGYIEGQPFEVEGEETIINARSSEKYRNELSWINSDNGWGVDFAGVRGKSNYRPQFKYARGGVLGSFDFSPAAIPQSNTVQQSIARYNERTEELIAAVNRRIDRLQVKVNISDIENASETKHVHIARASLP
ncbi:MAG: hypothetical protein IIW52_05265 [Alistipes sp.]|nr:hypothetical protein [Alistipes sp.]